MNSLCPALHSSSVPSLRHFLWGAAENRHHKKTSYVRHDRNNLLSSLQSCTSIRILYNCECQKVLRMCEGVCVCGVLIHLISCLTILFIAALCSHSCVTSHADFMYVFFIFIRKEGFWHWSRKCTPKYLLFSSVLCM